VTDHARPISTRREQRYTLRLIIIGALFLIPVLGYEKWLSFPPLQIALSPGLSLLLFVMLTLVTTMWQLDVPRYGKIPMVAPVYYSIVVLFGPPALVFAVILGGLFRFLCHSLKKSNGRLSVIRETICHMVSFGTGALIYRLTVQETISFTSYESFYNLIALALSALVTFVLLHVFAVSERIALSGLSVRYMLKINMQSFKVHMAMLVPLGLLVVTVFLIQPLGLILLTPVYIMYLSIRNYGDILKEARATIEDLAYAFESRDPFSRSHSQNVAEIAAEIAREMYLEEEEIEKIISAAKLHDLGKIGIADEILEKGKLEGLTFDEYEEIRKHPELGYRVTQQLSWYQDEARYIHHHHEWYDGTGYPEGLMGEEIPLGSRILAIAEAFDSMASPRSYRDPIPLATLMEELRKKRGTQFDPMVVDCLTGLIEEKSRKGLRAYSAGAGPSPGATAQ
jgi:HD-GYP domain-containing protein (c-di-GMP phosphodiesterase class II)